MAGQLFVVATPIGNLEDITYRAVRILREVAAVACEDTRQTRKLLGHYRIATPLISYHEHNEQERAAELVARMREGESIALVSDAGTPLVSDPGFRLVAAAIEAQITVTPIPGPSAALAALAAAGLPTHAFRFYGFLPVKASKREALLDSLRQAAETAVCYEAPHRIAESLEAIERILGGDRRMALAREITKVHEEFLRGTVTAIRAEIGRRPTIKGEFTVLIGPAGETLPAESPASYHRQVEELIARGVARMEAVKQVARSHGLGKRDLYRILYEDH